MSADEAQLPGTGRYPSGTVRHLLDTDLVTAPTRAALRHRLDTSPVATPRFFDREQWQTLNAMCARLVRSDEGPDVDIAGAIDERLANHDGDGWRYAEMPPDGYAFRMGLAGLDEVAYARCGRRFRELSAELQDDVLEMVQHGEVRGGVWNHLPARRFFEDVLAEAVEIYYSHPLVQETIGYVGAADAHGWHALGLDVREPHEPEELPPR